MNKQRTSSDQRDEKATAGSRPIKLKKALIAIGVIAFGLIVADRVLEAFRADDVPTTVATVDSAPANDADETAAPEPTEADQILPDDRVALVELQNLFGSRVVFVSATEPGFVVTEDERRIAVGDPVDDATTLAEVTTHQIILEKNGDTLIFSLPVPLVQ